MTDVININSERESRRPRKGMGYQPPPTSGDWLSSLKQGDRFLAKHRTDAGSKLTEFIIVVKHEKIPSILLAEHVNGRGMMDWHDPELFSQDYKFYFQITTELQDASNDLLNRTMVGNEEPQSPDKEP